MTFSVIGCCLLRRVGMHTLSQRRVIIKLSTLDKRHYASKPVSNAIYCAEMVRKYDYENYLCTLLLPAAARSTAFALRALNAEVATIRDTVTEKNIGLMRMQFWKDEIENIFSGNPRQQPVALELARAVERHSLTKRWLMRIIEARSKHLDDETFSSIEAVEEYGENTISSLHYLLLESLDVKNLQADHAASHLGKAQGLVMLLRSTPYHATRRRIHLPIPLLIQHGVSQEDVLRGSEEQPMKDLAFDIASLAHQHLEQARDLKNDIPTEAKQALLPAVSCEAYLKRIQKADFNLFHPQLQLRFNWLPVLLWLNSFRKNY